MKRLIVIGVVLLIGSLILATSCVEKRSGSMAINTELKRQVQLGEKVFNEKKCGSCHTTSGDFNNGNKGPDLASVFLAMNTEFTKRHLQFTELTEMAQIELTSYEINAVAQYIATLHGRAFMDANITDPDAVCPVSGAPLKKTVAIENRLHVSYKKNDYYFVSPDAKIVFQRDPEWHSKSPWLNTRRGIMDMME